MLALEEHGHIGIAIGQVRATGAAAVNDGARGVKLAHHQGDEAAHGLLGGWVKVVHDGDGLLQALFIY